MARRLAGLVAVALSALAAQASFAAEPSLVAAAEAGDRTAVIAELREGGDVNERGPDGSTALMWATYHGDLELVQRLIAAGADADAQNDFGAFALSEAAISGASFRFQISILTF